MWSSKDRLVLAQHIERETGSMASYVYIQQLGVHAGYVVSSDCLISSVYPDTVCPSPLQKNRLHHVRPNNDIIF